MKWLLLLALVACSTQKKEEPKAAPTPEATAASTASESEAKPTSPLTVKPCFCMKMYQPVCAGGVNYGNSCEAECHGHKTWKDGNCPETPKKK